MRVGLYPRVSTIEQAKEGYSIGEQTERLKKYCEAMGWEVYKIYTDPGYSGGSMDRPGLQNLISDVEDGLLDKVVVYKLDRLSRSQLDTLYLIEKVFLVNNTDFVSMSENFDTSTPFGRAMIGILAVFAQLEREQIKERTMMGKQARAEEGKWGGGSSVPIGYDYDIITGELKVNEYEKMQILEAIDLFLNGTPLNTIAKLFHTKGYTYRGRSGKVNEWEPKRLKYVFGNKLYLGYISYNGEYYKGDHEPIIDEDIFDKLQKLLESRKEENSKYRKKRNGQTTYLGGLIYCKQCGARYAKQIGRKWKDNEPPHYYCCYSRSKKVPKMIKDPNCINKYWRMSELDEVVFNEIRKLALDTDYIHSIREDKNKNSDVKNKIDIITDEIKEIDAQISRFMDLYGIGQFTIEQVSGKIDPLNERKRALEKELQNLNATVEKISVDETLEIATTFTEALERGDFNEIRLIIESLIYYIELDNDDIYIHWKFA